MAHVSARLQDAVEDAGPVVITAVAPNVRYGEEGNKRRKIDGEAFGRLWVFLADNEKNLVCEANVANRPRAEVIAKNFKKKIKTKVKVSRVRQIYKNRPGSLPLYCRKPKNTIKLPHKESVPVTMAKFSHKREKRQRGRDG